MSSSIEEELEELLRHRFIRPPRKFEERRLFNIENPREFLEKYRLPVEAFEYLLAAVGQQLEHKTKRNRGLTARQQLWCFSTSLAQTLFIMLCTRVHGIATSTVWNTIHRVIPAILSLRRELVRWPEQPLSIAAKFWAIAGFPCVAGCVDGTHVLVNPPCDDEDAYANRHHTRSLNDCQGLITRFISVAADARGVGMTHEF